MKNLYSDLHSITHDINHYDNQLIYQNLYI